MQPKTGFTELKHCALSGLGPPSGYGLSKIGDMADVTIRLARRGDEDELGEMRALLWPDATVEQHKQEAGALIQSGMSGTLPGAIFVARRERIAGRLYRSRVAFACRRLRHGTARRLH